MNREEKKTNHLTIRCQPALKKRVTDRARNDGRSIAAEAEILVFAGLDALEKNESLVASVLAGRTDIDPSAITSVRH